MFGGPDRPAGILWSTVIAKEIQRKHSRTHMGTGKGFVGTDDQLFGLADLTDPPGQKFCFLRAVAVRNSDPLIFGMNGPAAVQLYDFVNGFFSAPTLFERYDMSGGITPQQGFDVQNSADGGSGTADPTTAFQKGQIIHCEELQQVHHFFIQNISGLCCCFFFIPQIGGTAGKKTGAKAGTQ